MNNIMKKSLLALALSAGVAGGVVAEEEKVLNVYNWSDYIAEGIVEKFEAETGIKVTYDVFDSNEVLEAKLLSGNSGFDLVFPSIDFMARQIQAGVYQKIDKSKLPTYAGLDKAVLENITEYDPGNEYAVPYFWGTTGIGYNVNKVKEILGEDYPINSWDMAFDPATLEKLSACGVAFLDAPSEIIPAVLNYLGEDPNSFDTKLIKKKAGEHLSKLKPHVTYFHSSQYINDLANGDICLAVGWSGDVFIAQARAEESENGVEVDYVIPKEGASMFVDVMGIPKSAKHPENAHKFIDFLSRPEIAAENTNYVWYPSPVAAAFPLIDQEVMEHPGIFPTEETKKNIYTFRVSPPKVSRAYTRTWTKVKSGK